MYRYEIQCDITTCNLKYFTANCTSTKCENDQKNLHAIFTENVPKQNSQATSYKQLQSIDTDYSVVQLLEQSVEHSILDLSLR